MSNTIIGVYGRQNEGKSETLKHVINIFATSQPTAVINYILRTGDDLATIDIHGFRIGIESQGDPGSRMIRNHTIEDLITIYQCQLIVCATRTSGDTVGEVDRLANAYNFDTIWKSSYYTPTLNQTTANQICAEEIVTLLFHIMNGRL